MRAIAVALLAAACTGGGKGGGADDTGAPGDTGGGGGDDGSCPDEVPDEYRYTWDCEATSCDSGTILYHAAVAESFEDGTFSAQEEYFVFRSDGSWCHDTFVFSGEWSNYDPDTFNCPTCEELWWSEMDLESGNQCGLLWGMLFFGEDGKDADPPYEGAMMFDTHNELTDERFEDNSMIVVWAPLHGNYVYPDPDYGRGTATPTSDVDGPPQSYTWASTGTCLK